MGKHDRRHSPKMKARKRQAKLHARIKRRTASKRSPVGTRKKPAASGGQTSG